MSPTFLGSFGGGSPSRRLAFLSIRIAVLRILPVERGEEGRLPVDRYDGLLVQALGS